MIGNRGKEEKLGKGGGEAIRLQDCIESPPFLCIQSNPAISNQFSQLEPGRGSPYCVMGLDPCLFILEGRIGDGDK